MITCIDDLLDVPTVVILYYAGSSGEFLATLLSSLPEFSITSTVTDGNRFKFADLYGRSLNSGDDIIDEDKVVDRVNLYFDNIEELRKINIGLAHPKSASIEFLERYASQWPIIEITCTTHVSKQFRQQSSVSKITHISSHPYDRPAHNLHHKCVLKVEWEDLFINKTEATLERIVKFLGLPTDQIRSMSQKIKEYVNSHGKISS